MTIDIAALRKLKTRIVQAIDAEEASYALGGEVTAEIEEANLPDFIIDDHYQPLLPALERIDELLKTASAEAAA